MRKAAFLGVVLAAVLARPLPARAWGDDGHRVIGEIAAHYLEPRAARAVQDCLTEADFSTLADAATWADVYARRVPTYAWANPLHYVNVAPDAARYVESRDCPNGCVVTAIRRYRALLGEPGVDLAARKRRQEALYFLVHLVGDIHQPLHVAHPDGRGGNATLVPFFGESKKAHWVWDDGLLLRGPKESAAGAASSGAATQRRWEELAFALRLAIEPAQRVVWQKDLDPEHWANESLALAKQHAFLKVGQAVDAAYVATRWVVVRRQLQKAGVRLAAVLNATFGE
jgi:hypothetical protein